MLIVQNSPSSNPGRMGIWLREAGLRLDVVRAHTGEPLPAQLGDRALLVLGGGFLPWEDERAPWLPAASRLTSQALQNGNPILGICLGAQLLAHVAGGTVLPRHGAPEHGSVPIRLRASARNDPLFSALPTVTPAIEHHVDTITELPPGALWLAESDRCPYQGFRVGEKAWGVQFHPEAAATRVISWDRKQLHAMGFDPDHLYAQAAADEPTSATVWQTFTHRFAEIIVSGRRK
ncbi:type 1 glutamine amidotransferase [Streptomyces goshikiensis]|uniref:type 1 glutamine amidotransferase n=1 Tax=Streptomyces goshikiensis TaxID=1942 RepID=UPI003692F35C